MRPPHGTAVPRADVEDSTSNMHTWVTLAAPPFIYRSLEENQPLNAGRSPIDRDREHGE